MRTFSLKFNRFRLRTRYSSTSARRATAGARSGRKSRARLSSWPRPVSAAARARTRSRARARVDSQISERAFEIRTHRPIPSAERLRCSVPCTVAASAAVFANFEGRKPRIAEAHAFKSYQRAAWNSDRDGERGVVPRRSGRKGQSQSESFVCDGACAQGSG